MRGANLGAMQQSKFFADPELTEISMRLYVPLLENDLLAWDREELRITQLNVQMDDMLN